MTTFSEFKARVTSTNDFKVVIEEARKEFGVTVDETPNIYTGANIAFNLEVQFFEALIDEERYDEARRVLKRMAHSYKGALSENLMEEYAYRLKLIEKTERLISDKLSTAKQDFNHHTILIISIVVGTITIFGTASQTLNISNFHDAILTFLAISGTIILCIIFTFLASKITK